MFKNEKHIQTICTITTVMLAALCIYLPRAVAPVRWLALALSIALLPVFFYLQRTRPKGFLIVISLAYIANTVFLGSIIAGGHIFGLSTRTLFNIVAVLSFIVAIMQVISEHKNNHQHKELKGE